MGKRRLSPGGDLGPGLRACALPQEVRERNVRTEPCDKDDNGFYEPIPYEVSFITAPAVNAGVVQSRNKDARDIKEVMTRRIDKVLAILTENQCDVVVLGAFGCGVFKNDPWEVASIFKTLLSSTYAQAFSKVVFAIYGDQEFRAFNQVFSGAPAAAAPAQKSNVNSQRSSQYNRSKKGKERVQH